MFETVVLGRETLQTPVRDFGVLVARGATLVAEKVVLAKSVNGGVLIDPTATATLTDALLLAHRGNLIQFGVGLSGDARLYVERSKILGTEGRPGLSLSGSGSVAELSHVRFADNGEENIGESCGRINAVVSRAATLRGDHLDFTGGGVVVENVQTHATLTDVTARSANEQSGSPLCLRDGAIAEVTRLRAENTPGLRVIAASLIASDIDLVEVPRALSVQDESAEGLRGSTVEASKLRAVIAMPRTPADLVPAIDIARRSGVTMDNVSITGGQPAIFVAAESLHLSRFELSAVIGVQALEGTDLFLSEGRISNYQCGVVADASLERSLYTSMLYDLANLEQAVVSKCENRN